MQSMTRSLLDKNVGSTVLFTPPPPVRFGLKLSFLIALIAALAFAGCKDPTGSDPDLSGTITISPSEGVTTGTLLTAAYNGTETVTYQWNKGETAISGATGATYTPGEAGSYTVTVSAAGYRSKTSAAVIVTVPTVDKTALQTALAAANAAKDGTAPSLYWVKAADLTAFETAITAAQTVYDNAGAAQAAIDSAKTTLEGATTAFTGQKKDVGTTNPITALTAIQTAYSAGSGSLGTTANPIEVTIIVSGTITDTSGAGSNAWLEISGADAYPPIVLQGAAGGGTLNAASSGKGVLRIENSNKVTLGANLTLTGGTATSNSGGGVNVANGTFTMSGGTISGNTAQLGGGVNVANGIFTMSGGTVSGNTADGGGGVSVDSGTFTKTGGTIYGNVGAPNGNEATNGNNWGHAVYVDGSPAKYRDTTAGTGVNLDSKGTPTEWGK
ncbi:hypothetical protein AGMMS49546_25630 [Spirochaetia bacterium]|nr:hypothetical protein AGMMS49546_25630 [Spirochaetia bacterium]